MSARLACVRPAASVHSEPGSNSQVESTLVLSLTFETAAHRFLSPGSLLTVFLCFPVPLRYRKPTKTVKLTSPSSDQVLANQTLEDTIHRQSDPSNQTKPPTYLFKIHNRFKERSSDKIDEARQFPSDPRPPHLQNLRGVSGRFRIRPFPSPSLVCFGEGLFTDAHRNPQGEKTHGRGLFSHFPIYLQNLGLVRRNTARQAATHRPIPAIRRPQPDPALAKCHPARPEFYHTRNQQSEHHGGIDQHFPGVDLAHHQKVDHRQRSGRIGQPVQAGPGLGTQFAD